MSDRIKPCLKSLEFRDGVTCVDGRLDGVCHNHQVVSGLRHHAIDADRFELENRRLTEQLARVTSERDAIRADRDSHQRVAIRMMQERDALRWERDEYARRWRFG